MSDFKVSHGSVTNEKAMAAAARIESQLGLFLNGDKKAFGKICIEDLVVLIVFARNTANTAQEIS